MNKEITSSERLMIISADCHAGPKSVEDYRPYVEQKHLAKFDEWVAETTKTDMGEMVAEFLHFEGEARDIIVEQMFSRPGLSDPQARLRDMEQDGVVGEVIFPNGFQPFGKNFEFSYKDPELRAAGLRIYNRWLADLCSVHPGQRAGVAMVPIWDLDRAIEDVRWAHSQGLTGGIDLPGIALDGSYPPFNDAVYDRFWGVCEELSMTLNLHSGSGAPTHGAGADHVALDAFETPIFTRRALAYLIYSGVFDRFPQLKLAFTEVLATWVGYTLQDLDNILDACFIRGQGSRAKQLKLRPSEYWYRNCYIGASFASASEVSNRHIIGLDRIMWGSDYPHFEGTFPLTKESLRRSFSAVPVKDLRMMLGENAARCYNFDVTKLKPIAARIGPLPAEIAVPLDVVPERGRLTSGFREGLWA